MAAGALGGLGAVDMSGFISESLIVRTRQTDLHLPFDVMQMHSTSRAIIEALPCEGGKREENVSASLAMFW